MSPFFGSSMKNFLNNFCYMPAKWLRKKYLFIYPWKQTPFNGGINWQKNRTNPEVGKFRMLKLQFCRNTMELRAMSVQKCRCFQPKHYSGRIHHLKGLHKANKGVCFVNTIKNLFVQVLSAFTTLRPQDWKISTSLGSLRRALNSLDWRCPLNLSNWSSKFAETYPAAQKGSILY